MATSGLKYHICDTKNVVASFHNELWRPMSADKFMKQFFIPRVLYFSEQVLYWPGAAVAVAAAAAAAVAAEAAVAAAAAAAAASVAANTDIRWSCM